MITTEIQYMIGSIAGKFKLTLLKTQAVPKTICSNSKCWTNYFGTAYI
ncbi:hypothetical protein CNEO4_180015 [Clostridium neonatale]|nr:hypothetical protein CNEO4_180015 [Clostridium neonatale]